MNWRLCLWKTSLGFVHTDAHCSLTLIPTNCWNYHEFNFIFSIQEELRSLALCHHICLNMYHAVCLPLLHVTHSGNRGNRTFKPKKNIPEGSHQYELLKHAEATLGSGNLRMAVMLPDGEDLNEWVAVNSKHDFFHTLPVLTDICVPGWVTRLFQKDLFYTCHFHSVLHNCLLIHGHSFLKISISPRPESFGGVGAWHARWEKPPWMLNRLYCLCSESRVCLLAQSRKQITGNQMPDCIIQEEHLQGTRCTLSRPVGN